MICLICGNTCLVFIPIFGESKIRLFHLISALTDASSGDLKLVSLGFPPACAAASEDTEEKLEEDDEADDEDDQDEPDHVQQVVLHEGEIEGGGPDDRWVMLRIRTWIVG